MRAVAAALAALMVPMVAAGAARTEASRAAEARAQERLSRITAGRVAGPAQRCIRPELRNPTEIIDGQAIVYRFAGTAYVGRLRDGCPQLRQGRTTIISPLNGELCVGDPVRIVDTGTPLGHCVFGTFTPYTKAG